MIAGIRDITARKQAEEQIRSLNRALEQRAAALEATNKELEAFSYSVSHDLRAPLRSIDGFSQALLEDYGDTLDAMGQDYLRRVRAATQRMGQLIDDILKLSRITRAEMRSQTVDLSALAHAVAEELQQRDPQRRVEWRIAEGDRAGIRRCFVSSWRTCWATPGSSPASAKRPDRVWRAAAG